MIKSIIVSSLAISSLASRAHFSYPEDTSTDSWAAETVMVNGEKNYCGNTHVFQSPIDIKDQTATNNGCPTSQALNWKLTDNIHKFHVENTGHNLKMVPVLAGVIDNEDSNDGTSNDHDDSNENPEFENLHNGREFGVLTDIFNNPAMDDYCLDSFHIHWGSESSTGSEHTIDGKASVMEMHFVHRACNYDTISKAIEGEISDDENAEASLAVVSVMFEIGQENALIQKIVDQVDKLKDAHTWIDIEDEEISMLNVVPPIKADGTITSNYYHYKGSLTTPPCTPVVSWHVLEEKMEVTEAQLKELRDIMNEEETPGKSAPNFRGVKTNGHAVYKCLGTGKDNDDDDDDDSRSRLFNFASVMNFF